MSYVAADLAVLAERFGQRQHCCAMCVVRADGVLSYDMPQGDRRAPDVDLRDFTYDGRVTDHYLSGGLGQLTDGVEGHSNLRLDPDGWGRKGYEWVGWRNDSTRPTTADGDRLESDSIVIQFEFERTRRFTGIRLHCNNMFTRNVRVFRRAVVRVGLDATDIVSTSASTVEPVVYQHRRDNLIDFARNVVILLPNLVGRFVSVQLFFDAAWMLISEVRFESGELFQGSPQS